MKKKGFTLIELVVVMSLAFLILGVVGSVFTSYVKSYKNSLLQNNGFNYLNSAIVMIDSEVNQYASEVKTDGNIINIVCYKGNSPKHIKFINGNIIVSTNVGNDYYTNIIMKDIKNFIAIKTGKILYIKIIWHNGQSIERCLAIKNAN